MDRFTTNYGVGQPNPEDPTIYDDRERTAIDGEAPANRDGRQPTETTTSPVVSSQPGSRSARQGV